METTKKKKKPIIILIIVIVILALIVFGIVACSRALSSSLEQLSNGMLEVTEVERRDITNDISVSGQVESEKIVKVTTTVTAKVKQLNVEIGSEVHAGDVLCVFDSDDLQTQYDTLLKSQQNADGMSENSHRINERNLENAKADKQNTLAQAQRGIDEAVRARDNAYAKEANLTNQYNSEVHTRDDLYNQMNAGVDMETYAVLNAKFQEADMKAQNTLAQLEAIREQLPSYDSQVQSAKDAYASAERSADAMIQSYQDALDAEQYNNSSNSDTELQKLADAIADCTVKAPASGIITSLNVAVGSLPTSEALMTIEDKDALKITVSIAEQDILKIQEGQKAVVKTNATGDEEFDAKVTRVVNIYKSGQQSLYGQTSEGGYSAEISIDDSEHKLLIGMNAKVRIILDEKENVLAVPYESIIEDEDGTFHVLIADKHDDNVTYAKAAKVTPGMEGSYYTEITSDEVKEGDQIVVTPGDYKDGDVLPIFDFNAAVASQEGGADGNE